MGPKGLTDPPRRFKWAILGESIEGKNPKRIDATHLADPRQQWLRDRYIGSARHLHREGRLRPGRDRVEL